MISPLANIVGNLTCGNNCRIDPFVTITGDVILGDNVHVGVGACIFGKHGVFIESGVSISPGAKIFTATEDPDSNLNSNPCLPVIHSIKGQVHIGKKSVIGANSVVLPGVEIGDNVQVGALSLVKSNLLDDAIYAGIPAVKLRDKPNIDQIRFT